MKTKSPHRSSHRIKVATLLAEGALELRPSDIGCSRRHWIQFLVSEFRLVQRHQLSPEETWIPGAKSQDIAAYVMAQHRRAIDAGRQRELERKRRYNFGRNVDRKLNSARRAGLLPDAGRAL